MLRGITAVLVFSASAAAPAAAEVHTATWLGGNGGWFDASRWSTGVTPFNTATDQYDVIIDGGNPVSSSVLLGDSITVNSLALDGGLTIDAFDSFTALNGITLNNGGITMRADADVRVGLNGTITGSGGIFSYFGFNGGTVAADGGSLTLGSGVTVGATSAPEASDMTIGGNYPLVNNGIISNLHNFATVRILATSLLNNGTFQLGNGGKIEAGGTIDNLADLGTVINDGTGTLAFTGVYDNTASTLVLSGAPAGLEMGGTIQGGTVTATGANRLTTWRGGTLVLDNVTLNAPTSVKGVMRVAAGQTLAGNADIALDNSASLVGTVGGTFTINNGITLHGRGAIGGSALPLVTAAAITADQPNAELLVAGNGITNTGILRVTSNGILAIGGSFSMSGLGTIVNDGGTLRFAGSLNNDGQTFTNGSPHTWQLGNGGRIVGGTVETLSGHELVVANGSTATLDGVTLNGTVRLGTTTGAKLRVANGVSGSGTILLAGTATTATQIFNPQGNSFLPVVIGEGITIRGGGGTIGGLPTPTTTPDHVVNHGTIQSDAGTTIELIGATLSDGTLSIKHTGRIRSRGNLSFGDGGTLAVEVGGAGAQAVLAITGNLNLSGIDILELSALGGPVVDSVIATYTGTLSGTFDQVTPGFLVDYSANQVRVTAVPEPGAVAVIAMCGSLTCARARRRPRV